MCVCVCVCRSLGSHSRICQILTLGELYICKLTYLVLYLKPQDQALSHVCDHLSHMQSTGTFKWPPTHIPRVGHTRPCSACLLQLCYCKQVSFLWSSSCCIFVLSVGDFSVWIYSFLENPMDRGAWRATVQEVEKSQTWRATNTFHLHFAVWNDPQA